MFRYLILFLSAALALPLAAQTALGTITGTVTDPAGAPVPNVEVTATAVSTSLTYKAVTSESGTYVIPNLPIGQFTVRATGTGFKQVTRTGLNVEVAQRLRVDIVFELGSVSESVEIKAEIPRIQTEDSSLGTVVEQRRIEDLPLNGRHVFNLVKVVAGVVPRSNATDGFAEVNNQTFSQMRINGGPAYGNQFFLDGVSNTAAVHNEISVVPMADSVMEFRVETNALKAEYGQTAGGVINAVTKSGGNQFHGSLYEFLRNDAMDARNAFSTRPDPRTGRIKQVLRYNQYGGTLGGPVMIPKLYNGKNRTFWFASYEGLRQRSLNPYTGTVPTSAERNGDFSASRDTNGSPFIIYDPRTTRLDPDRPAGTTRYIRSVFPGNVVPANLIHPVAKAVLPYYPAATQRGLGQSDINNYFVAAANALDGNRVDARVDHQISSRHSFFARYNWFQNINAQPLVFGHFASPVETPNRIPGINWMGNHTWSIGAGTIFQHHFSMAQSETNRTPLSLDFDQKSLGLPANIVDPQRVKYFPVFGIGGLTQMGVTGTGYNAVKSRTWQYNASLTLLRGRHTFKLGGDWRRFPVTIDQSSPLSISASGSFTAGPNPQAAAARTGRGLADLMLGVAQARYTLRPLESHVHPYYAFYFQDEWKLKQNLTLTLGMRYSLELPRTEANNQYVFLDLDTTSPLEGKVPGLTGLRGGVGFVGTNGRRTQLADKTNWDPRIGLAWELNPKTVLRTGFGVFTSSIAPNTDASLGFQQTTSSLVAEPDGVTPLYNLSNPLPGGFIPALGNKLGLSTNLGQGISGPLRQQRLPYQLQWSFDVQRQLPWKTVVEVGYAASTGVALPSGVQYNQIPDSALALGTALNATVPNPFFGVITDSTSTLSRATIQRGQLLRPYPHFTGMSASQAPVGHSSYNALQTRVERRFDAGLALLFAYTKSKLIDNVGDFGGFLGAGGFTNNNCFSCDRSLSFYDIPDVVRLSLRYELPFGVGKPSLNRGAMARIAGGWSTAIYYTWENGTPVQVTGPNDSNSFGGGQRPNATGIPARLDKKEMVDGGLYFNPAAFSRAPQFTFGNVSRNLPDVRVPGMKNWDLLIEKRISFTERIALDFRTELFNAFNNVVFNGPQTNVTSADFGRIRLLQANTPRQIQFGLRLSY